MDFSVTGHATNLGVTKIPCEIIYYLRNKITPGPYCTREHGIFHKTTSSMDENKNNSTRDYQ